MPIQTTTTKPTTTNASISMPKTILTISLAKYLDGHEIASYLEKDWRETATPSQQQRFDNRGFNLDPTEPEDTLNALEDKSQEKQWDGVVVGCCTRGNKEFTALFEMVVAVVIGNIVRREKHGEDGPELTFSEGPEDLVRTTLRGFGGEDEQI